MRIMASTAGDTQPSQVPAMMACGVLLSPPLLRRPLTMVIDSRCFAAGSRILVSSKSVPVAVGDQCCITAPCGK